MKKCGNCIRRFSSGMFGIEPCMGYEMTTNEAEEIDRASDCNGYEEGTPWCLEERHYCPSATAGDYSPSCPWNSGIGMSVRDFI